MIVRLQLAFLRLLASGCAVAVAPLRICNVDRTAKSELRVVGLLNVIGQPGRFRCRFAQDTDLLLRLADDYENATAPHLVSEMKAAMARTGAHMDTPGLTTVTIHSEDYLVVASGRIEPIAKPDDCNHSLNAPGCLYRYYFTAAKIESMSKVTPSRLLLGWWSLKFRLYTLFHRPPKLIVQ